MTKEKRSTVTLRLNVGEIEQLVLEGVKQNEEILNLLNDADNVRINFIIQTNSYDPGYGQPKAQVKGIKIEIESEEE